MCGWLSHFLFGFPDPHCKAGPFSRWVRLLIPFAVLTVGLATWDVASDVLFIVARWRDSINKEPCALDLHWLILVTLIPCLPVVFSLLKGRLFHRHWAKDATFNWRLARKKLINSEEQLLVIKDGERVNPEESIPIWSCAKRGLAHRVKHIFPLTFFRRCWGFASAWKHAPDSRIQYTYNKDIEFQDFHLQRAQLMEIKYESCLQLIILLLIMGTSELYHNYKVWLAATSSFFAIAKYFPSVALLPGKCAFNNKIFGEKDCIELEDANKLLKPGFVQWFGALTNFFYIICRYHIIVSLAIYNCFALLLVIATQTLTLCVFLIVSYLRLNPASKYQFREESSSPNKRRIGLMCAFCNQLLTTMGYFLLVPVTTTMTALGTVLATLLQLIAIGAFAIVLLIDPANWADRKDCRGNFMCALTPLCPTTFYILLATNLSLSLLLPLLQRAIAHWTDSGFWLQHRTQCKKCAEFQDRYCNRRPCWLCEWTWCDEIEASQKMLQCETCPLDHETGQRSTPVAFLEKSKQNESSERVIQVLASIHRESNDDFLLCKDHAHQLAKTELEETVEKAVMAGVGVCLLDDSPLLALFSTADSLKYIRKFDPCNSMHAFLRELYSGKGLFRTLPYQLFYKSKLYDSGIKDPIKQNKYWMEIKKLRADHTACGQRCVLYENKSTASGKLKLEIKPSGMDSYAWRLDTANDRGKIIPDDWEYEYFNDVSVLSLDSFDVREPVRDCPLREQRNQSTLSKV